MEELAPFLEQAMARKRYMKPLEDDEIPAVKALGRRILEQSVPPHQNSLAFSGGLVPARDPLQKEKQQGE
ncbi:MAG: hypothetical protein V3S64_01465 [bacterium]